MKKLIFLSVLISGAVALGVVFAIIHLPKEQITLAPEPTPVPTPFAKYEIENLQKVSVPEEPIKIKENLDETTDNKSYLISQTFDPTFETGERKTTTGMMMVPTDPGEYPIVMMIRGYVDQKLYKTGIGTKPAAAYFSTNGFITVAPDFLGYAGSSEEAGNIFETRFQTYTTAMSIFKAIQSNKLELPGGYKWDGKNIFIWAHSNGGQIALTLLTITGAPIPTTLWAPVTKPFPYSVLYYTDESADGGKLIRHELAKFEELYDTDKYSFTNYLDNINAPLQLHQGTADDAVSLDWSNSFVAKMRNLDKNIDYFKYPGADHNLRPSWDDVVARDVDFFNKNLQN